MVLVAALLCATASPRAHVGRDAKPLEVREVRALASEIDQFLLREVTAHFDDAMAALRATGASDRQQALGAVPGVRFRYTLYMRRATCASRPASR